MRDGSRPNKAYKSVRGSHTSGGGNNQALEEATTQSLTQAAVSSFTRPLIGTTTYVPVLHTQQPLQQQVSTQPQTRSQVQSQQNLEAQRHIHSQQSQSLLHGQALAVTHVETHSCPQSLSSVQVTPRVLTQGLVYSHPQVLPQVNTECEAHGASGVQPHSQVLLPGQVHTQTQGTTQIQNVSPICTQLQSSPSLSSEVQQQTSELYAHSQPQGHTQGAAMPQVLSQTQIHVQPTRLHSQTHIHTQPQVHTHAQLHAQTTHSHLHLQSDSQQHLPALSQVTLPTTLPDLGDTSQIEESSQKSSEGLVVHIPVSRHHRGTGGGGGVQDIAVHSSSSSSDNTMNDVLSSYSHTQLMHTLTAFPLTDSLNTSISLQQNSASVSPVFTQSQILDALNDERLLIASKNSLGQTLVTEEPAVEMRELPALQGQESYPTCPERSSSVLLPAEKETSVSKSVAATPHPCTSHLNSQHMIAPHVNALHLLPEESLGTHLSAKANTVTTTTTSSLIASNRMLNKLLDSAKPHIPSQVTKAAEIAHLVPNPTARLPSNTSSRSDDLDDNAETTFTASSCGSNLTFTRSCLASVCTVTTSGRGGTDDIDSKESSSGDGIFGLPSPFISPPCATLVVPQTSVSHCQAVSQRQIDDVHQTLMNSQSTTSLAVPQLETLGEGLRIYPPTSTVAQAAALTSSTISIGNNLVSVPLSDKTTRKTVPVNIQLCNLNKSFNMLVPPEGFSKAGSSIDPHSRFQNGPSTKIGLITSSDPMFTSVAVTSGCSSPTSHGVVISAARSAAASHDVLGRMKSSTDSKVSHQSLVDILSRGSASDGVVSSSGAGISLMGLSDNRLPHTSDVLLSELHRSDESDLSLGATLSSTTGEEIHSGNGLVTEASLVSGIGGDSAPLQELPSPPLSSFSLPNITGDFMVSEVSGNKGCHPTQAQLSALLSNLPTPDLDRLLENSSTSMCIDIGLSDSEVSQTVETSFTYSPGKSHVHRKSLSASTATELTFTDALKHVTSKSSCEEIRLHSDSISSSKVLDCEQTGSTIQEPHKPPAAALVKGNSPSCATDTTLSDQVVVDKTLGTKETHSGNFTKANSLKETKSTSQKGKRRELPKKNNELLVQQVACFKCRLCSFLNQDKSEIEAHMRLHHSQYYSDTEESEEDVKHCAPTKKMKAAVEPENECIVYDGIVFDESKNRDRSKKAKISQDTSRDKGQSVKGEKEAATRRLGMHIKSEPRDVGEFEGRLIDKDDEDSSAGMTVEVIEGGINATSSDPEYVDDGDGSLPKDTETATTTTTSATSTKSVGVRTSQSANSKNSVTIKRKSAKKSSDSAASFRCDVNGCSLRLKSEVNIVYHRKCHVNSMLQCPECLSTKFQSWRDLALHLWRQHLIDMELHKCDKCDYKSYSYSKLMNVHHKIHSDERPSLCDTCGKRFKTPKQLRNHKTLHLKKAEVPQHQCEICHRPFSDKRMLRNHQESVHKKVKPFLCNYCGYSTASRSTLKMHMRQHTGEKPFACEKCKYRTSDHNSLRRHKMQHSGVRPYRCPYCNYASIQSTTFKVHLKDKHPGLAQMDGIMFTCGVCSFKTVKRDNFLAHVAEHSRGDSKKQRQTSSSTPSPNKTEEEPEGIFGDLPTSAPHVVNIDVESGTFTVESPPDADFLNSVQVQAPVPGQVIMAGDKYVYAAVDSSVLSQVKSGERLVQLAPDVVGVPLSLPIETPTSSSLQGLVYVATTNQGE